MNNEETGRELIDRLIGKLNNLPCCWEDFVGEDLADEVKEYMGWVDEDDEEEEEE